MSTFKVQAINRHRFSTDGKGVTTLVGLAGCPLDCKYCINKKILHNGKIKEMTPEELLSKVIIDYCYFYATGGGITFGGGEPLLQSEQILEFINILPTNIAVNIETSLNIENSSEIENLINKIDHLYIDIKTTNTEVYKAYTGKNNENTQNLLNYIVKENLQTKCTIRIPSIPNYTTKSDIEESIKIIKQLGFQDIDTFEYIIKD